jgi:hypothetical protein
MAARLANKPTKAVTGAVRTRYVNENVPEVHQPYYPPAPQLDGKPKWKISYPMYTPEQCDDEVRRADSDPDFHQRKCATRDVTRWKVLMATDRFVHFLPNGPVCYDEEGLLLNGKTRFTGAAGQNKPVGFMVIRGVPRWMFRYFDTGKMRTVNDVFHIAGRSPKGQTGATVRLAMRYAETIRGTRELIGWQNWASIGDEHADVDDFLAHHGELIDWYGAADQIYRKTKLNIGALQVWRYFQEMAWRGREADQKISEFWEGLQTGAMLPLQSPALVLRDWALSTFQSKEHIRGKRELHLLLLNSMFEMFVAGDTLKKVTWAHGFNMTFPYHPNGEEVAVKNVLRALDKVPV